MPDPLSEAKAPSPHCAVLAGQEFGQRAPATMQFAAQANAEEQRNRVEGCLPFGALLVGVLGQVVAQGSQVDQAQRHLKVRQRSQESGVKQVVAARVVIVGTIVMLWRRLDLLGYRKV
jgi:hypothetical protein